jgi:hypothetical protein
MIRDNATGRLNGVSWPVGKWEETVPNRAAGLRTRRSHYFWDSLGGFAANGMESEAYLHLKGQFVFFRIRNFCSDGHSISCRNDAGNPE